ncbi:MAG: elongation factor P maturation arginine rhamnosyltransferase EarP [Betaproteobacteria bacterium HGW-Betaproteobacteria-11]|nr:MAG: elongation factor P maturation arginine rhamnosyltransferase EarP [Betaproteobacteria bacterium HGW-Betaproteobacteria-11]
MANCISLTTLRCDIFCRVIDNYGDAGVCWRLARQLALEHGWQVRLWIDDPAPLALLAPDHASGPVTACRWPTDFPAVTADATADVVVEAFACHLPPAYIAAMAQRTRVPVWLNLDYLSAEDWVGDCHGLASPHPQLPLAKYFFFPGFDAQSGGLLRERDYDPRRQAFDADAFRAEFALPPQTANTLTVSLFSYPGAPTARLFRALAAARQPTLLLRPGSGERAFTEGNLSVRPLPFLPQIRYDELLWTCDLNFVRGEDSFVRAQWAGKPFVWQIYPQAENVHRMKLDAFLDRYAKVGAGDTASNTAMQALHDFWHAWNGEGVIDWNHFGAALPELTPLAQGWSEHLSQRPDLATNLVQFCLERLK